MKGKDMAIKSVAFNRFDPDQLALLEHANKRSNFSSYIKRLIQRDMEGGVNAGHLAVYQAEETIDSELISCLI